MGPYVVDFYCPALKVAVEIDGDSHFIGDAIAYDTQRQAYLESFGIRFLRFTNEQVNHELEGVLGTIAAVTRGKCNNNGPESSSPPS